MATSSFTISRRISSARSAGEGRPVGSVDVTDHAGDLPGGVAVRKHAKRLQIGPQHHVGFLDPDESLDGRAVEHDVALERLLKLAVRHLDVLVDAEDVRELETHR